MYKKAPCLCKYVLDDPYNWELETNCKHKRTTISQQLRCARSQVPGLRLNSVLSTGRFQTRIAKELPDSAVCICKCKIDQKSLHLSSLNFYKEITLFWGSVQGLFSNYRCIFIEPIVARPPQLLNSTPCKIQKKKREDSNKVGFCFNTYISKTSRLVTSRDFGVGTECIYFAS